MKTSTEKRESEAKRRGEMIANVLGLKWIHSFEGGPRVMTDWGSKTAMGLYETMKRIVEDGE